MPCLQLQLPRRLRDSWGKAGPQFGALCRRALTPLCLFRRPNTLVRAFWRSVSKWWQAKVKSSALIFTAKDELDPNGQFVLGVHPHAALPVSAIMNFVSDDWNATAPKFPKENIRVLVASFCFYLPVLRELYLGAGFVDASKFSMQHCLNDGHNVMVFPGGASEAKFCAPDEDLLVLRSRRGFVRVAIEHGIPLVPCYTFGETDVICTGGPEPDSGLFRFQNAMQTVVGMNIDPRMPLMPREDVPVCMVVGSPIPMPHDPNPSKELVEHHLQRYMDALFELHKQWQPPGVSVKPLRFLDESETAMP